MSFFNSSRDESVREKLEGAGVPILPATGCGFKLLKYLMDFVKYDPKEHILDLAVMEVQKKRKSGQLSANMRASGSWQQQGCLYRRKPL